MEFSIIRVDGLIGLTQSDIVRTQCNILPECKRESCTFKHGTRKDSSGYTKLSSIRIQNRCISVYFEEYLKECRNGVDCSKMVCTYHHPKSELVVLSKKRPVLCISTENIDENRETQNFHETLAKSGSNKMRSSSNERASFDERSSYDTRYSRDERYSLRESASYDECKEQVSKYDVRDVRYRRNISVSPISSIASITPSPSEQSQITPITSTTLFFKELEKEPTIMKSMENERKQRLTYLLTELRLLLPFFN